MVLTPSPPSSTAQRKRPTECHRCHEAPPAVLLHGRDGYCGWVHIQCPSRFCNSVAIGAPHGSPLALGAAPPFPPGMSCRPCCVAQVGRRVRMEMGKNSQQLQHNQKVSCEGARCSLTLSCIGCVPGSRASLPCSIRQVIMAHSGGVRSSALLFLIHKVSKHEAALGPWHVMPSPPPQAAWPSPPLCPTFSPGTVYAGGAEAPHAHPPFCRAH